MRVLWLDPDPPNPFSIGTLVGKLHRIRRQQLLREAEGYLDLISACGSNAPSPPVRDRIAMRVLSVLQGLEETGHRGRVLYFQGLALRAMERWTEAIPPLREAADLEPQDIQILLSLAWCYKRVRQIDLAIQAMQDAIAVDGGEAILHYNLACYASLAGNANQAVVSLTAAFEIDPNYRDLVGTERDFDPIRETPEFQALTSVIV